MVKVVGISRTGRISTTLSRVLSILPSSAATPTKPMRGVRADSEAKHTIDVTIYMDGRSTVWCARFHGD